MSLIFGGDTSDGCCRDSFRMKDDSPKEIVALFLCSRDISLSRYKNSPFCIVGPQYHWELCVINPPSFPVYFWLCGSKPWISEDGFLFSEFCEIESKIGMIGPCLNLQVGVVAQLPAFIFGTINIQ